ncbi:iron-sulfur cluster repair di-iron protein [Barnesiella intestinihominis]|jgi:regulator of cell morphogenesis and NO signaling|uniref:iron-sulfur cluster repair di-iron protein n=1 Tax=Barnesiella intestinihominis TaxID=487174 RepID=UPI0039672532
MKSYETQTVGQIVADKYEAANVFEKYGIDYCCHGSTPLLEACKNANVELDQVQKELENTPSSAHGNIDFTNWPIDLLIDYILKIHHRNIRSHGPELLHLLDKVCNVHGDRHPELYKIRTLFHDSLESLYSHLDKEELVLFPYIYEMFKAREEHKHLPDFHCGSIEAPISVMLSEHEAEGERFQHINRLTQNYTVPKDACNSYRLAFDRLKSFEKALHQHIHLENNIVFPRAIEMEKELRK